MVGDLTNRDIVFLLALAAVAAVALSRAGARATIASLLGAFRPFAFVVVGFAAYFVADRGGLQLGLRTRVAGYTIAWFLLAGLYSCSGSPRRTKTATSTDGHSAA